MDEYYNKHYIRIDEKNNIIEAWSNGPHTNKDTTNSICINEQGSYQFCLFPGGEENPPLQDENGIFLYKYINGSVIPKTPEEIQTEVDALPVPEPQPTLEEALAMTYYVGMMTGVL